MVSTFLSVNLFEQPKQLKHKEKTNSKNIIFLFKISKNSSFDKNVFIIK